MQKEKGLLLREECFVAERKTREEERDRREEEKEAREEKKEA